MQAIGGKKKNSEQKLNESRLNNVLKVSNKKISKPKKTTETKKKPTIPIIPDKQTTTNSLWSQRKDVGKVLVELGDKPDAVDVNTKPIIVETISKTPTPFRYMYDKIRSKSDTLVNQLLDLGEEILLQNELGYATPITTSSGSECIFVGRILCESESGEGKLNATSILLEGFNDQEQIRSSTVKLDVSSCEGAHLFPGQIVAIKGTKDTHQEVIKVNEIFTGVKTEKSNTKSSCTQTFIVAAGPFTCPDNLSFEPLDDLLRTSLSDNASLLVLVGPFVPADHPWVLEDKMNCTFDDLFEHLVKKIERSCEKSNLRVIIIPSLKDVQHDFVYPQPPFDVKSSIITCATNPCTFQSEGVLVCVNDLDVLTQLSQTEYVCGVVNKTNQELQSLRVSSMLAQKSMYPLCSSDWNVPFDSSFSDVMSVNVAPDLLIVPGEQECFAAVVDGVTVINPRRLGSLNGTDKVGGTFAKIVIQEGTTSPHVQIKNI
ncbi:DNA polymerase alpha subunit [Acrasis kona]|uniref:DNA polymerase alpha subunit B n=1 Tax=Acrasis kona TaxID=1008807 RepID=A0AAW2ZG39_9EUKA